MSDSLRPYGLQPTRPPCPSQSVACFFHQTVTFQWTGLSLIVTLFCSLQALLKAVCVLLRGIQVLASPLVGQRCEVWNKGEKAGLFWYLFLSLSCLRIAA